MHYLVEGGESNEEASKPFIGRWVTDKEIKVVTRLSYVPGVESADTVGMVPPFRASQLAKVARRDEDRLMQPVHTYWANLLPKAEHREFFIAVFANIVQHPGEIPRVCTVLEGQQGSGKNIFLSFMASEVLGLVHCSQASTLSSFFDTYSGQLKLKSLVVMDEVNQREGKRFADRFKDAITSGHVNVNEKYQKPMVLPNMASWFVTTNNRSSLLVEPGDRRFCLLDCSDKMCGVEHVEYWSGMARHFFHTDGVARAVYQYLQRFDVEKYRRSFMRMRPESLKHEGAAQSSIPDSGKYLSYMCGRMEGAGHSSSVNTGMNLMLDFKEFLAQLGFSARQQDRNTGPEFLEAMRGFARECVDAGSHACVYKRRSAGFCFVFVAQELKERLRKTSHFHPGLYHLGGGMDDDGV